MSIPLNDNIKINAPKPSEERYLNNITPHATIAAANIFTAGRRHIGLTVNINNEEYWYEEGILDADLVPKTPMSKIADGTGAEQFSYLVENGFQITGSGDTTVSFDSSNKRITITSIPGSGGGGAVTSFNSRTGGVVSQEGDYSLNLLGDVTLATVANGHTLLYNSASTKWENKLLNTSIVPELTNLYYTEGRVNANTNVAANTAARHDAVTLGTANGLSLATQVLSLGLATTSTTGALSSTDWNTFNGKANVTGQAFVSPTTATVPTTANSIVNKAYADGLVVGLLDDRGSYDATGGTFPTLGGSGVGGVVMKGDFWYVSVAGTLGGKAVTVGDSFRALVDTPGQTATNWSQLEGNIGYVPANAATTVTTTAPLTGSGTLGANLTIGMPAATASVSGYLTAADFTTFAGKQAALSGTGFVKSTAGVISYDTSTYLSGTVGVANGGTGITSYVVGDLLYANTTTTLAKLADVVTGNSLISGGAGVAPSWGKIGLTTHISGILPYANGGTGTASVPTLGGIVYGNTTAYGITAAGTSGQFLKSAGAAAPTWDSLTLSDIPGSAYKESAKCATTAALAVSAATATTLTGLTGASAVVFPAQDGSTAMAVGDRVLVKDQTVPAQNGIYSVTTLGVAATTAWVLTRTVDATSATNLAGAVVNILSGTINGGVLFTNSFKSTLAVGTDAVNWYRILDTNDLKVAGASGVGAVQYNSLTSLAGAFDGSAVTPLAVTNRLNYSGYFYPTYINLTASADTATAATHYFVETATDGYVRPKLLADVQTELVTNALVIGKVLTGLPAATNVVIAATDSILTAFGKVQGQISAKQATVALTTTGASGAATFTPATGALNIPAYTLAGLGGITLGSAITGYTVGTNTALAATDTILAAFGKLQGQVSARLSAEADTLATVTGRGATTAIAITSTANITALAFFATSDIRLKEIVETSVITPSNIKPISYKWKDKEKPQTTQLGYSAQEVQLYMPDAVKEDEEGMLSVNYIQVLIAKVAELEKQIKKLKDGI